MKALEYFKNGYSCSESIVKAAIDEGLCPEEFLPAATAFSSGMSSGCCCGTVCAAQMVAGYQNREEARARAKHIIDEFKKLHKVTCCRILSAGLEGPARKQHCAKFVVDTWKILEDTIKSKV